MASTTWTPTDTSRDIHHTEFRISAADVPSRHDKWSVTKRTLRGGLSDGVELVELFNGRMSLFVIPSRGMSVWKATAGDDTLGWRSPVRGPVHPRFVPLAEPSGLGWLDGFDELVVRCGLESNGGPDFDSTGNLTYALHGRIANRPAHSVDVSVDDASGTLSIRGVVEESRFHFQKLRLTAEITTAFDSMSFSIADTVQNFGGTPAEMQMLYHINFGEPLLAPGAQIVAPVRQVAPHDSAATENVADWQTFAPPTAGAPEQCFFFDLATDRDDCSQVLLKNSAGAAGAAVQFNAKQLPHFTIWKNMVASDDGYVTGLEPATNFPNPRSFETAQGRVVSIAPGGEWKGGVDIRWLTTPNEVAAVESSIREIQSTVTPVVQLAPLEGWSP